MIIVKMNNSTVECSIAASELREIGLTPESLMSGTSRSTTFMSQLNKEVGEQLGYDPEQEVLLMSKNMMADGSVHIFAVKMSNDDIQRTADRIRESALQMLSLVEQDKIDAIKQMDTAEKGETLGAMFMDVTEQVNHIYMPDDGASDELPTATTKPVTDYERYTVEMKSLDDAIRFARVAKVYPVRDAALYKSDEKYYMVVTLPNDDDRRIFEFRKTCVEYADALIMDSPMEAHISETGESIIAKDAIAHLAAL